ncbi:hypothetical protein D3C78_1883690 [compost metagenome]
MKSQATRIDALLAQEARRKQRFELMILTPLAVLAMAIIGFSFGVFFGGHLAVMP